MRHLLLCLLCACAREPEPAVSAPIGSSPTGSSPTVTPTFAPGVTSPTTAIPPSTGTVRVELTGLPAWFDAISYVAEVQVDQRLVHAETHTAASFVLEGVDPGEIYVRMLDGSWESYGSDSGSYAGLSGCMGGECTGWDWGDLVAGTELVLMPSFDCVWAGCD